MLLTRLPLGIATSFDLHVLGTPPALILSQDQTLHKNSWSFEQALSSLTGRTISIARARRSIRIASPDLAVRLAAAGFVINCTGLVLGAGLPGGAGGTAARILLIFDPDKQKRGPCGPRTCLSGSETHRLMRYCTVQFSRNGRFRQAHFGPDH